MSSFFGGQTIWFQSRQNLLWTLLRRSIRHPMRWLWRCFQSRYDNSNPFFLSQFIEKSPIFKKREIENGGKRNGDQKSKQRQVKCSTITTTAAIAELIGRKKAQPKVA